MRRSPCLNCQWLDYDKNDARCENCRKRLDYLAALEQAPECRQDPCYAMAYNLPRSFARQIGPARPYSQMATIIGFAR